MRSPNILLIMADQLSAKALPMYGHKIVKAPNLMRLAERSAVFANAYCNFPICAPSRYSMLSGRLAHSIGAFDNASEFPSAMPTIAHYLDLLGYRTTLCGKMHFVGPDQLHGYQERLITDIYPANFAWVPDWTEGPTNAPTGISMRAVVEAGQCLRSLQIDYDDETEFFAQQKLYDLARQTEKDPFFLTVSFSHPHSPFVVFSEHWNRYRHEDIDLPSVGAIPLEHLDTHSRWLYHSHGRDRINVTNEHILNARHAYYGMISYIDDKVGRLLRILEDTGMANDTMVIFISDHGEMLGERGMWYKQTFFEWATRVPLLIAGPGIESQRTIDSVVSLVDLFPTILELATQGRSPSVAGGFHGTSLLPLLGGRDDNRPNVAVCEYSDMGVCAPCRMIRMGTLKYSYTHGFESQLFDLERDALELKNITGDLVYREQETELRKRIFSNWNPEELNKRILQSQAERRVICEAMSKSRGKPDNWSYMVRPHDAERFVRGGGESGGTVAVKGRARFPYVPPTPAAS
jgi:choline-sulfatase